MRCGATRRASTSSRVRQRIARKHFCPDWDPSAFGTISILADFRDRLVEGQRAMGASDASLQIVTALGELRQASAAATALAGQVGRDRHRLARVIRAPYFALSVLLFCVFCALSLVASR